MMKKRWLLLAALACFSIGAMTACGEEEQEEQTGDYLEFTENFNGGLIASFRHFSVAAVLRNNSGRRKKNTVLCWKRAGRMLRCFSRSAAAVKPRMMFRGRYGFTARLCIGRRQTAVPEWPPIRSGLPKLCMPPSI